MFACLEFARSMLRGELVRLGSESTKQRHSLPKLLCAFITCVCYKRLLGSVVGHSMRGCYMRIHICESNRTARPSAVLVGHFTKVLTVHTCYACLRWLLRVRVVFTLHESVSVVFVRRANQHLLLCRLLAIHVIYV